MEEEEDRAKEREVEEGFLKMSCFTEHSAVVIEVPHAPLASVAVVSRAHAGKPVMRKGEPSTPILSLNLHTVTLPSSRIQTDG